MQFLTKSKFKLGMECPNKLFYASRKDEYANQKMEDSFLESLAKGGFQVEALARLHYPEGVFIDAENNEKAWNKTKVLLQKDQVTLFEAAFKYGNLFVKSDIIVKDGNRIRLIEVKAKSYDPTDGECFMSKRGGLKSKWVSYFFDLAFQKYVIQHSFPEFKVTAYLMLADKSKCATINGLNQMFRIPNGGDPRRDVISKISNLDEIGESVLTEIHVNGIVDDIVNGEIRYEDQTISQLIEKFDSIIQKDEYPGFPPTFKACKKCEFKATTEDESKGKRSGFKECFKKQLKWSDNDFKRPTIFEIWNLRSGQELMSDGRIFLDNLTESDFSVQSNGYTLTAGERQWLQVQKSSKNDPQPFVHYDSLKDEMDGWKYPYHFIDFETSAVALPYNIGSHPYEQVAFQFSHHIMKENGSIEHKTQYINNIPGEFPNFLFVRALMECLEQDEGSIFRYANHENSILNVIKCQLENSRETDKDRLINFIMSITESTKDSTNHWQGVRSMVDLKKVIVELYYNPLTKGSNSLKYVLPSILKTSDYLKRKYGKPISEINVTSLNLPSSHVWLKTEDGLVVNPYKSLPPLFEDWDILELENNLSDLGNIADGGAALTAYSKLQFEDMSDKERKEITKALLKYCELDTLAMVMLVEHFKNDLS